MAVFVGYGDESGKQDDQKSTSSAYGILVGPNECWDAFDESWDKALRRTGIEYFHRKEFGKPNGPYAHLDETQNGNFSRILSKPCKMLALKRTQARSGTRLSRNSTNGQVCPLMHMR